MYLSIVTDSCLLESTKDGSEDQMNPLTVGLMILLALAMTFITLIAIISLIRRRPTGTWLFRTHRNTEARKYSHIHCYHIINKSYINLYIVAITTLTYEL